jgi:hypothetical protein
MLFFILGSRVEVNCYYDTSIDIGKTKNCFLWCYQFNGIHLDTFGAYQINRTIREGGRADEYPEKTNSWNHPIMFWHIGDYTMDNLLQ